MRISEYSVVIARLQPMRLRCTSVQNPLTSFEEAVTSVERVLDRQEGPTVLVGHSFAGMLVTQCGIHPLVSSLVYVAARAPDAGEDYAALTARFPTPPASAGIIFDGDEGMLIEEAFLRDFAGDLPEARARVLHSVQMPFQRRLLSARVRAAAWRTKPSYYAVSAQDRTNRSRSAAFHGSTHERQDCRAEGQPFAIVLLGVWASTQWAAAMLAYQPELGEAWFRLGSLPVYRPWALFGW